jgi:diguanylate cyclase (GGDEF)-like protein
MLSLFASSKRKAYLPEIFIILFTLLLILLVWITGERSSEYHPLLDIPIVLAITLCSAEFTILYGLVLSFVVLLILHPFGINSLFTLGDLLHFLTINAMAITGSLFMQQNRQQKKKLEHSLLEQEALLNASQIINSADKLEHALNSTLLLLRTLIPRFRCAAIFLADDTLRRLELIAVSGLEAESLSNTSLLLDQPSNRWSFDWSQPLYSADNAKLNPDDPCRLDSNSHSAVCISLRSLRISIGMLYISFEQKNGLTSEQLELLQSFADRIGFPIQKIRIQEGLQGLAYTDSMTGLFNFRAFRMRLEEEIRRAIRYKHPVSLIIIDLDGFKLINDKYGHPDGDQILSNIGAIIHSSVRLIDIPVRYGGEEFAIICPETLENDAYTVAERIRSEVEAARFKLHEDNVCSITLSAGVSTFPTDANDIENLIKTSDASLYEAKNRGKNCVCTFNKNPVGND